MVPGQVEIILTREELTYIGYYEALHLEGSGTPVQDIQKGGRGSIPGDNQDDIQGEAWQSPEQPDPTENIPTYHKGVGLDDL